MQDHSTPGYHGKVLRVDLTKNDVKDEELDAEAYKRYIGGVGLCIKFLYDEVSPGVEWDDPENRLIFFNGPLSATRVGGSGCINVASKGPMTNYAGSSQANGFFGAYLKLSGYDGIIIQGKASKLSYLHVSENGAEVIEAAELSMKDTFETEAYLKKKHSYRKQDASVCSIGPAGEHLVRFANIIVDEGHSVSHNGLGAVMGSKNLKAIMVTRGSKTPSVHDRDMLNDLAEEMYRVQMEGFGHILDNYGTAGGLEGGVNDGWVPYKNYTTNVIPREDYERLTGQYMRATFEVKPKPCWACRIKHVVSVKVTEGPYKGFEGEVPDYEIVAGLGTQIKINDPGVVTYIGDLVDRLGIDANESGWLLGWMMECYQKGFLTKNDLDGLEMRWGNHEAAIKMLKKIAFREGCGDFFADGTKRSAESVGGEAMNVAVHSGKGAAPRGHDHRGRRRWVELFDTCVSDTSTCQTVSGQSVSLPSIIIDPDNPPEIVDPFDPKQVSDHIGKGCGWDQFLDCLGICRFNVNWRQIMPILNAVTGWELDTDDALTIGRRIVNQLRVFNQGTEWAHRLRCPRRGMALHQLMVPTLVHILWNTGR